MPKPQHLAWVALAKHPLHAGQVVFPPGRHVDPQPSELTGARLELVCGPDQGGHPRPLQTLATIGEQAHQVCFDRHHQLGGCRRRPRLPIGNQVGKRPVRGVSERGYHRHPDSLDGAHHCLLVEGHQFLEAAAAPGHDTDVGHCVGIALAEGGDQAALRGHSLDLRRVHHQTDIRESLPDGLLKVVDDGAPGRGDQRDAAREERQSSLALLTEGAFGVEAPLELLDGFLELAHPVVVEPADHQVEPPRLRVEIHLAGRDELLPVLRQKRQAAGGRAEYDRAHGGARILEGEPDVPSTDRDAADLPLDRDTLEAGGQQVVDTGVQLQHGERADRLLRLDGHQGTACAIGASRR